MVYAWHFVSADRKLAYSSEPLELGRIYRVEPPIVPCNHGLHGSVRLIDALRYAPGPILTRCRYGGQIVHHGDKLAAETREVLWIGDVTNILWLAACQFAETACRAAKWTDPRSLAAIAARRGWVAGMVTDGELAAACAAACAAAGGAAWDEQNEWLEAAVRDMAGADHA